MSHRILITTVIGAAAKRRLAGTLAKRRLVFQAALSRAARNRRLLMQSALSRAAFASGAYVGRLQAALKRAHNTASLLQAALNSAGVGKQTHRPPL